MKLNLIQILKCMPLVSVATISSCSVISDGVSTASTRLISHPSSFHGKRETVNLKINPKRVELDNALIDPSHGFLGSATVVSYAAGEVFRGLEKASQNFSMTYSQSELGSNLRNLKTFKLNRQINGETVAEFEFHVKQFGGFSYIEIVSAKISKAKAATPFWDNKVDVVCEVKISIPKKTEGGSKVIIQDAIVVNDIVLSGEISGEIHGTNTELFPILETPFQLSVTITEVSNYNKASKKGGSWIGVKKNEWIEALVKAVE
jgi:hypothetical protein